MNDSPQDPWGQPMTAAPAVPQAPDALEGEQTPESRAQLAPSVSWLCALGHNLRAGAGLALGRSPSVAQLHTGLEQCLLMAFLLLILELGGAYLGTEAPVLFDGYGLNYLGASWLFSLLALLLVTRLAGGTVAGFAPLLVAFLGAALFITLVSQLLWQLALSGSQAWGLFVALLLWQGLVVVRLLRVFAGAGPLRRLVLGGLYSLALFASAWMLPRNDLWYTDASAAEQAAVPMALDVESVFYAQPGLMQQNLAALEPQRPGVTDLYLLALGGFGLEDVFLKEVEFVREQFDRQYDTAGRSVILANNPATVEQYPLASGPNLARGLASVAQKMDTDEDVLFLFMTSHGSRDHRFSLEFGPVELHDLTPEQVRQALDDAGIRWRVILVSSCFSGGFIEALQSPQTLVITAAAADRTSFGCGVDSDFTWFGTAFFKQALPRQPRFIQAFDIARRWVTEKEEREELGASLPQMFVGDAIEQKLESLYQEPGLQAAFSSAQPEPLCDRAVLTCEP
ncbi:C13 family peptidase [Marinobacterium rhizophilum]|uniref:Peptidase C13-like protein n=1 Tax=Marinobacterium rhizophilum TaxID=420402 RepID=A0ABY5HH36_9GAMM|nr:C13 family peptidase [Marinobacterium rhizophilum]UTW11683.1 hypothetical protein KDW95_20915 [Marinobacterium rhizophilum]